MRYYFIVFIFKVKEGDELHTYLLLDFLNVLFEALLADNPDEFNQLLLRYIASYTRHYYYYLGLILILIKVTVFS